VWVNEDFKYRNNHLMKYLDRSDDCVPVKMIVKSCVCLALVLVCWDPVRGLEEKSQYHEMVRKTFDKLSQNEWEPNIFHRVNVTTQLQVSIK
jgi:hypothetical protein